MIFDVFDVLIYIMMGDGIEEELGGFDANPERLLGVEKGKIEVFMKDWYLNSEREEGS